jgi:tetratricopeptide (TPR) repeat protein
MASDDIDSALDQHLARLQSQPDEPKLLVAVGRLRWLKATRTTRGKAPSDAEELLRAARHDLEKAVARAPSAWGLLHLGYVLGELGEHVAANGVLLRAAELDPTKQVVAALAHSYSAMGDEAGRWRILERAAMISAEHAVWWVHCIETRVSITVDDEAEEAIAARRDARAACLRAEAWFPESSEVHRHLAKLHASLGDHADAIAHFGRCLEVWPRSDADVDARQRARVFRARAESWTALGEAAKSAADEDAAETLDPRRSLDEAAKQKALLRDIFND